MSESIRPSDDELEEAFSVALSHSNPFAKSYEMALEAEDDLNDCLADIELSSSEAQECMDDITEELNDECDHIDEYIEISGYVKQRIINHRLINKGEPIPESATTDHWKTVMNHHATSLGFIALMDGTTDRPVNIYHLSRSEDLHVIGFDSRYGGVYVRDRIFIPIDGSVHVELNGHEEPKWELLDYYIEDNLIDTIETAIDKDNLNESLQLLSHIDLSRYNVLMNKKADPEIRRALVDYINHGLGVNDKNNILYQLNGTDSIFIKESSDKWTIQNINKTDLLFGTIESIVIDQKSGKFHLLAKLPFQDNSRKHVIFQLNSGLSVTELPALSIKTIRSKKR